MYGYLIFFHITPLSGDPGSAYDHPLRPDDHPDDHPIFPQAADALTDDLLTVTAGRSTLLITHRLRGLDRVDRVVVLIAGQVRAVGTHEDLVAQGGWYAERWRAEQERGDLAALIEGIPAGTALVR